MSRLALLCFCLALGLTSYVVLENWLYIKLTPVKQMQQLWDEDVELMQSMHELPPGWKSIREIELTPGSKESMEWFRQLRVPVEVTKSGQYKLQILFYPWQQDGKQGAYLQYDLVDLKSSNGNTVWENARTLILSDKDSLFAKIMERKQIDWMAEAQEAWEIFFEPKPEHETPGAEATPTPAAASTSKQQSTPKTSPTPTH